MRKKRGYNRETPIELVRDYKLFAIVCEGQKREPNYFKLFRFLSQKVKVDVIEEIISEAEALHINPNKSAPKWVLDRAVRYIEKEGLSDEDDLWFVMDIDRWDVKQLFEIAEYCKSYPNWNIVLSNPCFEVWLYLHKKNDFEKSSSKTCSDLKSELSQLAKGGYNPITFLSNIEKAITNAKSIDTNKEHFMPNMMETKVYLLGEAILNIVSKSELKTFIDSTLPILAKTLRK